MSSYPVLSQSWHNTGIYLNITCAVADKGKRAANAEMMQNQRCRRQMRKNNAANTKNAHKFKTTATFFLHICFAALHAFASPSFLWWQWFSVAASGRLAFGVGIGLLQNYNVPLNFCQSWSEIKPIERKKKPSVLFFALLSSAGSCSHSAKSVCPLPLGLLECKSLHL